MHRDPLEQWRRRQKPHPTASKYAETLAMLTEARARGRVDSTIFHMIARYEEVVFVSSPTEVDVVIGYAQPHNLILRIGDERYSIPVIDGLATPKQDGSIGRWGIIRIGLDAWALTPSLFAPGVLHAFVVIVGCPENPPWAKSTHCPLCGQPQGLPPEITPDFPRMFACENGECRAKLVFSSLDPVRLQVGAQSTNA